MGVSLDYSTLNFCSGLTSISSMIAMLYVWRVHRRDAAVLYWLLGFLVWAVGIALLAFRPFIWPIAYKLLVNFLGVISVALIYLGTARFLGKPPARWLLASVYVPAALVIIYSASYEDSIPHRVLAYSFCIVLTAAVIARDLWFSADGPHRSIYRFVGTVWIAILLATVLRASALFFGAEVSPKQVALPQAIWFVVINAANILSCIGFLLMVSQRLQEKNNWARMEELFHETIRLPAEKRAAHLKSVCDGDKVLLAELESLVRAAESPTGSLDSGVMLGAAGGGRSPLSLAPGTLLGAYRIRQLLGQGGMGEVYLAEHVDAAPGASVAIKLLRTDASQHLDRFVAEHRILAALQHPGIARFFDAGVADDGRPFMVLEYVQGQSIIDYCRHRSLPLKQRLSLFKEICEAVDYAHRHFVVHRDLKPANILVTEDGRIKLLDFGVAKLLNPSNAAAGNATVTQAVPFTPDYAAPEQLEGRRITAATDVYALGVLMFELLTDELPWKLTTLPASVALHRVLNEAPRRPSEAAAANRNAPVLARLLRDDLDAIVGKCLRKLPVDRYASVKTLTEDVERHLEGKAVTATSSDVLLIVRGVAQRNPLAVRAAAMTAMLLIGFVAGMAFVGA